MKINLLYLILPVLTEAFLWNWLGCATCGGYGGYPYIAYPPVLYNSLPEYYAPTYRVVSVQSPPTVVYKQRQPLVFSQYNGYNRAPFSYSTVRTAQSQPPLSPYSSNRDVVKYSYLPSYLAEPIGYEYVPIAHQLADTYGRKMNEPRVKNKLYNAEGRKDQQMRKERITKETIVPIVDLKRTTGDGSDKKLLKNKMDANGPEIVKLAIPPNLPAAHPDVKEELERERNMQISPEESKISKTEQLPNKSKANEKEKKKGPAEETEFIPIGKDVKP